MLPMRLAPRDLLRLTRIALIITATWLVIGIFFGWRHHTIITGRGEPDDLLYRWGGMSASMFAWAILTPVVMYVSDAFPLRKPFRARNLAVVAVFAVLVALVRAMFDAWLPVLVEELPLTFLDYRASVIALFHTHFLFAVLLVSLANFVRLEREESERRHRDARLESELTEARLRQLRADLHPHFLFNALNAVAALLHRDPKAAAATLVKLRELLSASLATENTREVRLAEELEFLARYFDIQKMRFGEKLTTAIHVAEPHLNDAAVPPLLLQPLVENSIVHGISRRRDGGTVMVLVESERSGDDQWLFLQVRDNGPGCDPETILARGSVGVPNAVARLTSMYGRRQSLEYKRRGDAFIAEIRIPLRIVT